MSELQPSNTTVGDLCNAALQESGRLGIGQTAMAEDVNKAWARLQWMLQGWERKRWLVYQLATYSITATGAESYTFGPGGQINTNLVATWAVTSLAPTTAGTGYVVGDSLVLDEAPASSTPADPLQVVVTALDGTGVSTVLVGAAAGYVSFLTNANPGETVTINGVVFTFIVGATSGTDVHIGASVALTIGTELLAAVEAEALTNDDLSDLAFGEGAGLVGAWKLNVYALTAGEAGNDYTLAASVGTVSAATLEGGSDAEYQGPLPVSWTQSSTSGRGLNCVLSYAEWEQGAGVVNPSGSVRPAKLESAFLRQLVPAAPNQIDYPLQILQSMEDYNRIELKSLESFSGCAFLDPGYPLGTLYAWPVAQSGLYAIYATVRQQLPTSFATLATAVNLPFEYYQAIVSNLAMILRGTFQIPSFPGDPLPGQAKGSLSCLRGSNTAIGRLSMPTALTRPGIYNIFSDRSY